MTYFSSSDDVSAELVALFDELLSTKEGRDAARTAGAAFEIDPESQEPTVAIVTTEPASTTLLILGGSARVQASASGEHAAQIVLTADADALHDLLIENYDAGQIARAIEERRITFSGAPWALDALILLAGQLPDRYRASLTRRGRDDLLNPPPAAPAGFWEVSVPRPEDYLGTVVAGRRTFIQTTSK